MAGIGNIFASHIVKENYKGKSPFWDSIKSGNEYSALNKISIPSFKEIRNY
jgi:hypothetical protein